MNQYLDNVKENRETPSLSLKFYVGEKEKKSKKYLFFETHLDSLPRNSHEDVSNILYDKSV